MLYEVDLKLNKKEYKIRLGIEQVIKLQKLGINLAEENNEMEETLKVLVIGLSFREDQKKDLFYRENGELMSLTECVNKIIYEFEQDPELTFNELAEKVNEGIDLALNKGKEWKKREEAKNKVNVKKAEIDVKNF